MSRADRGEPGSYAFLLFAAAGLVVIAEILAVEYADPDLWGRIAVGAVWFQTGALPHLEDFSYTALGARWIDHEWLSGVIFYAVLEHAGESGLELLKHGLTLTALAGVFALVRLGGGSPLFAAYGLVLVSPVTLLGFITTVRAQAFTFPLFVWTLWLLEAVRQRRIDARWLGLLLPVAVFWGNAHGGFVMGTLAISAYAAAAIAEARWRDALALAGIAAGTLAAVACFNPYGLEYASFLLHAWTLDRSAVTEWQPLLHWPLLPFEMLAMLLVVVVAVFALAGGLRVLRAQPDRGDAAARWSLAPSLVLLLVAAMTLRATRIQTFLGLAAVGLAPLYLGSGALAPWPVAMRAGGRIVRQVVPAAAALLAIVYLVLVAQFRAPLSAVLPRAHGGERDAIPYPVGAVHWLRHSPYSGNLLNPFTQGEFLLWSLYPRFRVAIDGRYEEVYTQQQLRDVRAFYADAPIMWPRQLAYAENTGADFVLFGSRWPNLPRLAQSPGWRLVFDDGEFALVAREAVLARAAYAGPPGRPRPRVTIGSYFGPSDLRRFRAYPSGRP